MEPTPIEDRDQAKKGEAISPLRTYERDIAELVERENVSLTNITLAEQAKRSHAGEKGEGSLVGIVSARNKIFIVIGLLLLAGGGSLIGYLALVKKAPVITQIKEPERRIISAEFTKELNITGLNQRDLLTALVKERRESTVSPTSILHLRLTIGDGETKHEVSTEEFLTALKTTNPSFLTRALSPEFFLGLHSLSSIEPFLILKVADYDNTFSGMLAWEKKMLAELGPFLVSQAGTGEDSFQRLEEKGFEDRIIRNKDARVLPKQNGIPVLIYSLPDKETLVITTNENTFKEVTERLRTAKLIR